MRRPTSFWALTFAGLIALQSGQALAAARNADEARDMYSGYQRAVQAAQSCRDLEFTQEQHTALSHAMDAHIRFSMGAERLHLLVNAKEEARDRIARYGCDDSDVQKWLDVYDTDLAPALEN